MNLEISKVGASSRGYGDAMNQEEVTELEFVLREKPLVHVV